MSSEIDHRVQRPLGRLVPRFSDFNTHANPIPLLPKGVIKGLERESVQQRNERKFSKKVNVDAIQHFPTPNYMHSKFRMTADPIPKLPTVSKGLLDNQKYNEFKDVNWALMQEVKSQQAGDFDTAEFWKNLWGGKNPLSEIKQSNPTVIIHPQTSSIFQQSPAPIKVSQIKPEGVKNWSIEDVEDDSPKHGWNNIGDNFTDEFEQKLEEKYGNMDNQAQYETPMRKQNKRKIDQLNKGGPIYDSNEQTKKYKVWTKTEELKIQKYYQKLEEEQRALEEEQRAAKRRKDIETMKALELEKRLKQEEKERIDQQLKKEEIKRLNDYKKSILKDEKDFKELDEKIDENKDTPWKIFSLNDIYTKEDLAKAWRKTALKVHPDKHLIYPVESKEFKLNQEKWNRLFKEYQVEYENLKDDLEKRQRHNHNQNVFQNDRKKKGSGVMWGGGIEGMKVNAKGKLAPAREDAELGIFGVDKIKLKQGILSIIRMKTRKKVNEFPNCKVSTELKNAVMECINGVSPNVSDLSSSDQLFLAYLIRRSHVNHISVPKLNHNLNTRCVCQSQDHLRKLQHQLQINLGEIQSGNNSRLLLQDTVGIVKALQSANRLSITEAGDILKTFDLEAKQSND